ncbi:MAG: GtrA family protein [Chloroflexi bacterium]|nr:GtrA family protein [Chloroflexota bacterium]
MSELTAEENLTLPESAAALAESKTGLSSLFFRAVGVLPQPMQQLIIHKEMRRFIKFAVVGAIGFVVDFGTTNLLWSILPEDLTIGLPFGLSMSFIGLGGAIGFLAAITSNFIWNRYWTYPDSRSKSIFNQFFTFLFVNVVGILIRIPILEIAAEPLAELVAVALPGLGTDFLSFLGPDAAFRIGKNLALIIAVVIVMFWNFFVNRYWTYNDVE